jgi:hypothetical protein
MEPQNDRSPRPRRWWQHWLFKTFYLSVLNLVLILVGFYVIERELGERAWKKYQKKAAERGVKLRLEDYEPPAVADDENYAAAPIFQKLFATPNGPKETVKLFKLPDPPRSTNAPEPKALDLTEWQKAFVRAGWIPSAGTNPASDVLTALERVEGPLSEVRLASARPKSRWPVKWSDGPAARFHHYGTLQAASLCFAIRARALLALDRADEALSELGHIVRIDRSISNEPTLLPPLVRAALWLQILNACEQGIAANKLKSAQLQNISKEAKAVNFLAVWKFALNSERGIGNHAFNQLAASSRTEFSKQMNTSITESYIWIAMPRGWIRSNQVEYNELIDLDLEDIDAENERVSPLFGRGDARLMKQCSTHLGKLRNLMTSIMYPVTVQAGHRACAMHSRFQQFEILRAIAAYREAHGTFPQSLDELVPQYLDSIPNDVMDGKPMRYRRKDDGGCAIWSIGVNRVDDEGKWGAKRSSSTKALDWVVELPAAGPGR